MPRKLTPQPIIEINDPEVLAICDQDNGEPLVSIQDMIDAKVIVLPSSLITKKEGLEDSQNPMVRKGVKKKLQKVVESLGKQYTLVLIDAHRSYKFQKELFEAKVKRIIEKENIAVEKAKKKASKVVSNPDVYSPHLTGGAVDVAIMDNKTGDYLDMGNKFDYDNTASLDCPNLTPEQQSNRNFLVKVMKEAGFENYPNEWWHWSDGDKYAAMVKEESYSKYSTLKLN